MQKEVLMKSKVVMNKYTGDLAELTNNYLFGKIIWIVEYDKIPKGSMLLGKYIIFNDEKRFKDYEVIGNI